MSGVKSVLQELEKKLKTKIAASPETLGDPERLPSGVFAFDLATGGGVPTGRMTILYGTEGSMKSTLALKLIAQAQKRFPDQTAVYVDVEGRFSADWAVKMGVDMDRLTVVPIQIAEQLVDIVEALIYAEDLSVIVVDSLAALVTKTEMEKDAEQALVGVTGVLINKFYRKAGMALGRARVEKRAPTLILINQIRMKIGVMFGNPETMPGGMSFLYGSSFTVRLYGKDEVDKELSEEKPAYRVISAIIKKESVPIVQKNFEYKIALLPNPKLNLKVGESYDLATILAFLKACGLFAKADGGGWVLPDFETGEALEFKTQDELKTRIVEDAEFGEKVRAGLIKYVLEKGLPGG